MKKYKKWYEITVAARNGESVFNGKPYDTLAKVQSIGLAYKVAEAMKEVYKPEFYFIVVE